MNKLRLPRIILSGAIALASCALASNALAAGHGGGSGGGHAGGAGFSDGHSGGDHFGGGHRGGGDFARHFGSEEDWTDDDENREDPTCWQYERIPTRLGWRWSEVWVCN